MKPLSEAEIAIRQRLKDDFVHYAPRCLRIRTKAGKVNPLELNRAQRFLHERLEAQRRKLGRVRALVLKGRQQGVSTYIGGRFYHRVTHAKGQRVFILTHEQEATDNLFDMVDRFHEHCPVLVKPHTGASNAKELSFDLLDSGYSVGTAGTKAVGRSQTLQLFHGSEVAFWPNADSHASGVLQAVPDLPGTEVILESTANGMGNFFHQSWQQAEAKLGDYEAIFIPWFWQDEYQKPVDKSFVLDDEEAEYQALHDLSNEQMAWRRSKIIELRDPLLFKQEYPATASEAFQLTGHDSFIPPDIVMRARKTRKEARGPLILGVDPSRMGGDRFAVAFRAGRVVIKIETKQKLDNVAGAGWIKSIIDREHPDRVFVDIGGQGSGVGDLLMDWFGHKLVRLVDFGGKPHEPPIMRGTGPLNRRAEMWMKSKEWLEDIGGAQIPDSDSLQTDACAPGYRYDAHTRLVLESKEHIVKRGQRSPDEWDAVCFEAGTLIATPSGSVAIEQVQPGDKVLTPFGEARVVKRWETSTSKLSTAKFSNGSALRGKPDHRIFAFGHGEVRLDALALTMEVSSLSERDRWLKMSGLFTRVRSIGFKKLATTLAPGIQFSASGFCIAAFGLSIKGQFQRALKSITAMMIGGAARSTISNALVRLNTPSGIRRLALLAPCAESVKAGTCGQPAKRHENGINQKKASRGIERMALPLGMAESLLGGSVRSAEGLSSPSSKGLAFARPPVKTPSPLSVISQIVGRAFGAARAFRQIVTGKQRVAPVNVQTESVPPTLVYNLTLDRDNAYYANGILVFNCLTFAEPVAEGLDHFWSDDMDFAQASRSAVTGY